MTPSRRTIVPRSITFPGEVTIRAPTIACASPAPRASVDGTSAANTSNDAAATRHERGKDMRTSGDWRQARDAGG